MLDNLAPFDSMLGLPVDPVATANARILASTFAGGSSSIEDFNKKKEEENKRQAALMQQSMNALAKSSGDDMEKFFATISQLLGA